MYCKKLGRRTTRAALAGSRARGGFSHGQEFVRPGAMNRSETSGLFLDASPVHFPEAERLVLTDARQGLAVRGERNGIDFGPMSFQGCLRLACFHVPQTHFPIRSSRGQRRAIRRKGHAPRTLLEPSQRSNCLAVLHVPQL